MKKFLLINWKHHWIDDIDGFVDFIKINEQQNNELLFLLAPPHPLLGLLSKKIPTSLAAQGVTHKPLGPYTGTVGAAYLGKMGIKYVLLGHHDMRINGLTEQDIELSYIACLQEKIQPILCCGAYDMASLESGLKEQLRFLMNQGPQEIMIAYEPYWAIGKESLLIDFEHLQCVYQLILSFLPDGSSFKFFYGGGLDLDKARSLIKEPFISGLLLGRLGLNLNILKEMSLNPSKTKIINEIRD
jgi:triosephosphate isomerase